MTRKRGPVPGGRKLFRTSDQMSFPEEPSLEEESEMAEAEGQPASSEKATHQRPGAVECLGLTFESDEARRAHFTEILRCKLKDPEFRKIEGFPIGSDEDILGMSDPPYYTACPNPFLADFVRQYGKPYDPSEPYRREPFAVDVSEGKTDPLYAAHSYHTKVPYKAIVRAILHYTEPGDLVLDGFAGSGMVGVAAQVCGKPDPELRSAIDAEWLSRNGSPPKWGVRKAILNDLSPAATFIAANYNLPFDVQAFARAGEQLLKDVEEEIGWMYETLHTDGKTRGRIEYTVWSQVFACPECGAGITFVEAALDGASGQVRDGFPCPGCRAQLTKDRLGALFTTQTDHTLCELWKRVQFRPVQISYVVAGKRQNKKPDENDLALLAQVESLRPESMPAKPFPVDRMYHGSRLAPKGFTHVHRLYLPRAGQALAALWRRARECKEARTRHMLLFLVEQAVWTMSILNRFMPAQNPDARGRSGLVPQGQFKYRDPMDHLKGSPGGPLTGVYYVPSLHAEVTPWHSLESKFGRLTRVFSEYRPRAGDCAVTTGTAASLAIPGTSVDYIFTDPPFGENIFYGDLNFMIESWHRVWTDTRPEAVVDRPKGKGLAEYQDLMTRCFREYHRVLKPGRWMTVVFHNSSNAVWNAIQEAMQTAGFVVADVRTLDKKQGSYRQVTSTAMKQDLVISAYKPHHELEERFPLMAGAEEGVWHFVRNHLGQLPVFVSVGERGETLVERAAYLLYDRMVAFHVQRGVLVPMSAAEFYAGLKQRFPERDGMYFLPDQAAEYDRKRLTVREMVQLELSPTDEATAIQWLRQQLEQAPRTLQDLTPEFMRAIAGWERHERPLELRDLLAQNFLCYDGQGPIPEPIWAWMEKQSALREMAKGRDRENPGPQLQAEAADRWYVPDPSRAQDLEKLRERALLKEFEEYRAFKGRQMKLFRLEAVRAGFRRAWQQRDYRTIIDVAAKIPEEVLQEDPKLLMWYDQAVTRVGEA